MKKALSILFAFVIFINLTTVGKARAISFTPKDPIYSQSAVLYNIDTGTIVYEKKSDMKKNPVQLVQIMTAIVTMEKKSDLHEVISVPGQIFEEFDNYRQTYPEDEFPYNEVITCDIEPDEQLQIESLLHCMLLNSSCDAASTLAYCVGEGSIENFVNMMNETAKKIGANDTKFTNPHGLYDENQYSTAKDMMLITNYALNIPGFSEIVSKTTYNTGSTNMHPEGISVKNANVMMFSSDTDYFYPGASGIKTGKSVQSGRCLVTRATKDGSNYLVVLMDSPLEDVAGEQKFTHINDAKMLFDWAFDNIKYQVIVQSTEEIGTVKVNYAKGGNHLNLKAANDVSFMWLNTYNTSLIDKTDIKYVYSELNAPIKAGTKLGELTLRYQGQELGTVDVVAYYDCEFSTMTYAIAVVESYFKSSTFYKALKIATALSVVYFFLVLYTINKRAKRRRAKRMAQSRASK